MRDTQLDNGTIPAEQAATRACQSPRVANDTLITKYRSTEGNGVRTISRPHPVALAVLDHVTVTLRVIVVALPQLSVAISVIV